MRKRMLTLALQPRDPVLPMDEGDLSVTAFATKTITIELDPDKAVELFRQVTNDLYEQGRTHGDDWIIMGQTAFWSMCAAAHPDVWPPQPKAAIMGYDILIDEDDPWYVGSVSEPTRARWGGTIGS